MDVLKFDLTKTGGKFKPLNAVNNGPCYELHTEEQYRTNIATYRAARIPYARNHDASYCPNYGSEHTVDITAIFPNFDADEYDSASYDFVITDEYVKATLAAGTKTFYRLGQKIEHWVKKFGTLPPKDFKKWAVICEHVIRHYTEGWNNGFDAGIEYWEIWNEADLSGDDCTNKRTWGGSSEEFFRFYEITAKHLKSCFPNLKIGGPALAGFFDWIERFFAYMQKNDVPIDFVSWHLYRKKPEEMLEHCDKIWSVVEKYGYGDAECILNEWNYLEDWGAGFVDTIKAIISIKGAAYTMACMAAAQPSRIDMLMYYDARPSEWNGLFDYYTLEPIKGYYPFLWYGMLYDAECEIRCESSVENIYPLCGRMKDGKSLSIITYYSFEEDRGDKELFLDFGRKGEYEIYLLDKEHDGELVCVTDDLHITMQPNTVILVKEK